MKNQSLEVETTSVLYKLFKKRRNPVNDPELIYDDVDSNYVYYNSFVYRLKKGEEVDLLACPSEDLAFLERSKCF